jgi:hypothetical protein
MRALLAIGLAPILTGCAFAGNNGGPTSIPEDAQAAIWSSKPQSEVAACLAQKSGGADFEARALDKSGSYQTIVTFDPIISDAVVEDVMTNCA